MLPLTRSRAVRVWLERDGEPVMYEVSMSTPCTDLILDRIDLRHQARRDNLSLPAIRTRVRRWMCQEPNVDRVSVTYAAGRYTAIILASRHSRDIMACLHTSFETVLEAFGSYRPLVYVFAPPEHGSALLHSPDCCITRQ